MESGTLEKQQGKAGGGVLELKEITKRYVKRRPGNGRLTGRPGRPGPEQKREKEVLKGVSLKLDAGIYGLLGPNGAGKSTLMNIITGNIRPDGGQVLWNGKPAGEQGRAFRSVIGYAPQQQGLYPSFSGRRFLSYMAALKGLSRGDVKGEIERALSCVNMETAAGRAIRAYSGGMRQRILIAQAILGDPRLVVLDEPTAGLDPKERVRIRELINALSGDRIILVSTHVVSDIAPVAKEVLFLREGRIADRGTVEGLCVKYGCPGNLEGAYMSVFGEEGEHDPADPV